MRAPRTAQRDELDEMAAVCCRAFWPDPMFGFFSHGLLHEYRYLPAFFETDLKLVWGHCEPTVVDHDGRIGAVAVWIAPEELERPAWEEALRVLRSLPPLARAKHRLKAMRLLAAVEKVRPKDHRYLALLATDPAAQGRGLASSLLAPVLVQGDEDGVPTYLETQKESNVAWYARHGFRETGKVELPGCPPIWLLTREPQPG